MQSTNVNTKSKTRKAKQTDESLEVKEITQDIHPEFGITYFQFIQILDSAGLFPNKRIPTHIDIEDAQKIFEQLGIEVDYE